MKKIEWNDIAVDHADDWDECNANVNNALWIQ